MSSWNNQSVDPYPTDKNGMFLILIGEWPNFIHWVGIYLLDKVVIHSSYILALIFKANNLEPHNVIKMKSLVQKQPKWRFRTTLHKTSKLSTFLLMLQWPNESYHVANIIILVIWIEFSPKLYQVTLLLARKQKLLKCQEIPIISAGGKKQFCCCPWWMWLKKKIAN